MQYSACRLHITTEYRVILRITKEEQYIILYNVKNNGETKEYLE